MNEIKEHACTEECSTNKAETKAELKLNPNAYSFTPMAKTHKPKLESSKPETTKPETTKPTNTKPTNTKPASTATLETDDDNKNEEKKEEEEESKLEPVLNHTTEESPDLKPANANLSYKKFDNAEILQNLIRVQTEYLFSDYHLTNDTYLLARMSENSEQWISIKEILRNPKIRCLTNQLQRVVKAIKESEYLEISLNEKNVRRPNLKLPELKPNRDLRRSVFLFGIPDYKTEPDIRVMLSEFGQIKRVHFETDDSAGPIRDVSLLIMKKKFLFPARYQLHQKKNDASSLDVQQLKKLRLLCDLYAHPIPNPNGDETDFSHLQACFVVFASQSQASKCVKARARAVDGMRCIHKYDYNKVAKKFTTAKMKGETLSFSPQLHPLHSFPLNVLQSNFVIPTKDVTGAEEYYGAGSVRINHSNVSALRFRKPGGRGRGRGRQYRSKRAITNFMRPRAIPNTAERWVNDTLGRFAPTPIDENVNTRGIPEPVLSSTNTRLSTLATESMPSSQVRSVQKHVLPPELHHPLQPDIYYEYPNRYDMYMNMNMNMGMLYEPVPYDDFLMNTNIIDPVSSVHYADVHFPHIARSAPFGPMTTPHNPHLYVQLGHVGQPLPMSPRNVFVHDDMKQGSMKQATVLSVMSNYQQQ